MTFSRSHAPRGNAFLTALRSVQSAAQTRRHSQVTLGNERKGGHLDTVAPQPTR